MSTRGEGVSSLFVISFDPHRTGLYERSMPRANSFPDCYPPSQARSARLLSPDALAMVRLVETLEGLARVAP